MVHKLFPISGYNIITSLRITWNFSDIMSNLHDCSESVWDTRYVRKREFVKKQTLRWKRRRRRWGSHAKYFSQFVSTIWLPAISFYQTFLSLHYNIYYYIVVRSRIRFDSSLKKVYFIVVLCWTILVRDASL